VSTLAELSAEYRATSVHELLAHLRDDRPVTRVALPNGTHLWMVTRYEDVRAALGDTRLSTRVGGPLVTETLAPDIRAGMSTHLLRVDGDDHRRLRRLISSAFSSHRMAELRPMIEATTSDLLDGLARAPEPDIIRDLAFPLPLQVIYALLGIPPADHARFRTWSVTYLQMIGTQQVPTQIITEFVLYLRDLIAWKRDEPDEGLLSAMIAAQSEGDRLSEDELTSMCVLLIVAGYETPMNMIGNIVYLLLSDPAQADRLRADPSAVPTAVEEFLRFEGPTPAASFRIATAPVELSGQKIETGELVSISLQSANRDPRVFPDAQRLVTNRSPNTHLAFGHGIHYCLGAPLARIEAATVMTQLLARFPRMVLKNPAERLLWWPGFAVRGLSQLPVTLNL
jgi:cytochrome P450